MRRYKTSLLFSLYTIVWYVDALIMAGRDQPEVAWTFVVIGALMSLVAWGAYYFELEES